MVTISEFKSKYEEWKMIGQGGQKKVYKVVKDGEIYALKIMFNCNDPRVLQEIEILQRINIVGVPKVFDYGTLQGEDGEEILYLLEEYICAKSLRERIVNKNFLSLGEAISLLEDLLKIVVELEKEEIVHRDIKPENILITNNQVFLIDFGVAKIIGNLSLTSFGGGVPHTPGYAPYEQIMNDRMQINSKTDMYQIGVTVYELITGVNPFVEGVNSPMDIYEHTMNLTVLPIQIQGDTLGHFSDFILMLMAKNQSQRPENASKALSYLEVVKSTLEVEW